MTPDLSPHLRPKNSKWTWAGHPTPTRTQKVSQSTCSSPGFPVAMDGNSVLRPVAGGRGGGKINQNPHSFLSRVHPPPTSSLQGNPDNSTLKMDPEWEHFSPNPQPPAWWDSIHRLPGRPWARCLSPRPRLFPTRPPEGAGSHLRRLTSLAPGPSPKAKSSLRSFRHGQI